MMPTPRRCAGCGAALGAPTDDDLTIVCTFCGLRHDINDLAGAAGVPVTITVDVRGRPPRLAVWLMGSLVGLVLLATALGVYLASQATNTARTALRIPVTQRPDPAADRRRPLALTELATLTESAWKTVDAPPPPGGADGFEPDAALPWAMSIARAWASDAVLTRIDVGRVDTNGRVDLSGEDVSGYRFRSPARERLWKQEQDAGSRSTTPTAMLLQIRGDAAQVLLDADRRDDPIPPAPASLPLPDLLTKAKTRKGFADRPFYAGYMIHLPREGWVWYFRTPSGDSFPRVRARDGRVYPY